MKKMKIGLLAGVLLLAGTGCQSTVNTVENQEKTMTPNIIADQRFVTDASLRDRLQLTRLAASETPEGLLRVQLTAVNVRTGFFAQLWSGITGDNPYQIQYKFSWFDQNEMAVESILSTWKNLTVIPGETVYIQSIAPSKECKDFMINLKEANKE
ncbi:MAG: YcfL family protein [Victivallaceae bacterium]